MAPKDAIHVATALDAGLTLLNTFDRWLIGKLGKLGAPALVNECPSRMEPKLPFIGGYAKRSPKSEPKLNNPSVSLREHGETGVGETQKIVIEPLATAAMKRTRRFSIAPMMDWTDRHCRFFHRILTKRALLYTEMITADAILHGDSERLLGFSPEERPLALQLGGSDPAKLEVAAKMGASFGYDEINLNVGCPSDRVQDGRFGACLMREPEVVAACVERMRRAVDIPVTVKCRIGVDDQDAEADLDRFIAEVAAAGGTIFIVHARKAWLKGLSPKENREVPPLDYDRVFRLKQKYPQLTIILNGGIGSLDEAEQHLTSVDGVMLGRAAYHTPYVLAGADQRLFGDERPPISRRDALQQLQPYIERHLAAGGRLSAVTRHILGLYNGCPGARTYRRILGEGAAGGVADLKPFLDAMSAVAHDAPEVSQEAA